MRSFISAMICLFLVSSLLAGDRDKGKPAKPQVTPSERIEQLLEILKNDRKDDNRAKAAVELGTLASPDYPEITSGLIDALVRDDSSSVRKTVIRSLGAITPQTHEVKDALDQAVKSDKTWTVRQAARLAVWRYKPQDEPPASPGPRMRNTSKPTSAGTLAETKPAPLKPQATVDPLKGLSIPTPPVAVIPAVAEPPAPLMAPAPGLHLNIDPLPALPARAPARLTAPKPQR